MVQFATGTDVAAAPAAVALPANTADVSARPEAVRVEICDHVFAEPAAVERLVVPDAVVFAGRMTGEAAPAVVLDEGGIGAQEATLVLGAAAFLGIARENYSLERTRLEKQRLVSTPR